MGMGGGNCENRGGNGWGSLSGSVGGNEGMRNNGVQSGIDW